MEPTILIEKSEGWAALTLNRPDRLNSFNEDMHRELAAAMEAIGADESCRAVLLTGAGRGFCAGQDLGDRMMSGGEAPDLGSTIERLYNPLVRRIRTLRKPVICAVNGVAAGAGAPRRNRTGQRSNHACGAGHRRTGRKLGHDLENRR
jgi:2-(1,2-epoxy-1,2-dihydrophenyl)acetyl-CoA isomerase